MIDYSSKDILYSAQASSKAISSTVISVGLLLFMNRAKTFHLSRLSTGFGLTTILLSSHQEHPDKNKMIKIVMSIFFIWSIITFIGNFVN